ncbi:MAG: DUF6089 family protein [Bacteroidales bacterium]
MGTKTYFFFCLFLLSLFTVCAQSWRTSPWEVQLGAGPANYFGDIGGAAGEDNWYGLKDFEPLRSRLTGAGVLRYNRNRYLSFSGSLALGWLSGSDEGSRNEARGYVFNTLFLEPSGRVEFYPVRDLLKFRGLDRRGLVRNYSTVSVYLFGGAGAVIYSVMPNDKLRARRESDNIEHGPVTVVLPAGAGVRIGIQNTVDIGLEIGGRYAFNDYLDGFTSPTSTANDIYYITTVNVVYRFEELFYR